MSNKAIVKREHNWTATHCTRCGVSAQLRNRPTEPLCEPHLATVPEGWEGDTVDVDDNTAEFLKRFDPT